MAQIIHLPALRDLPDLFEVTALCDLSDIVLERVGSQLRGAKRYGDYRALLGDPQVDAVLIANPHVYHAEVAIAAMAAGKHVLVEKPMCINLAEADALLESEQKSGVTVQVGFMRRHAPAFVEAVERVAKRRSDIILARVHDVIGANAIIIDSTSLVARDPEVVAQHAASAKAAMAAAVERAIGKQSADKANAYGLLLGLASHDVSAMRELLGRPKAVLYAAQRHGGRAISGAFDYGSYVCQFETAVDQIPRYDTHLEVFTPSEVIRVDYDTPYVRSLPAKLSVLGKHGAAGLSAGSSFPTRYDSFTLEWRAFHRHISDRSKPKASLSDAREDLEIFRDMIALMP